MVLKTDEAIWLLYYFNTEAFDRTLPHVISLQSGEAEVRPYYRSISLRYAGELFRQANQLASNNNKARMSASKLYGRFRYGTEAAEQLRADAIATVCEEFDIKISSNLKE